MKKLIKFLLATSMLLCGFVATANAATVRDDEGPSSRAYYDPTDQILRTGEYLIFGQQIWDCVGSTQCQSPYRIFTVNQVDATGDRIYCNELGAWLPAYPLTEVNNLGWKSGNQILAVGEKFIISESPDSDYKSCNSHPIFKVYNVDAPSDSVQIHLKNKSGSIQAVWIYAAPTTEFNTNFC